MSDETEVLRQQIATQIREAFADTPYPGDHNIGWGCGSEGAEFEEALRGQHWHDLSIDFIFFWRGELPCTTPDGFRFYLPAFMIAALLHYDKVDTLSGNLIVHLSLPEENVKRESFLRHVSAFDRIERAAILAFLESYLQLHPEDYPEGNSVYRPLLDKAIAFWKHKQ